MGFVVAVLLLAIFPFLFRVLLEAIVVVFLLMCLSECVGWPPSHDAQPARAGHPTSTQADLTREPT